MHRKATKRERRTDAPQKAAISDLPDVGQKSAKAYNKLPKSVSKSNLGYKRTLLLPGRLLLCRASGLDLLSDFPDNKSPIDGDSTMHSRIASIRSVRRTSYSRSSVS